MPGAFQYRPKFVDIRVRPPKPEEEAAAAKAEADVFALKPGERPCDHADCRLAATAKAPKSRERMHEHYWFCQAHAAEYNKSWNFFAGMNDEQIVKAQAERATGERPTWSFKASNRSREAAAQAKGPMGWSDPFSLFGFGKGGGQEQRAPENVRHLGKMERNALADLDLSDAALGPEIRARYTELVKRCHPDANGGDRSTENRLQRVIKAFKTLRKAGMV